MDGVPGCGLNGPAEGTRIDRINGAVGTVSGGGSCGDSGNIYNSDWPASDGELWTGGFGSQYGGGTLSLIRMLWYSLHLKVCCVLL